MNLKAQGSICKQTTHQGTGTGNEEVAQWRNTAQYLLELAIGAEKCQGSEYKNRNRQSLSD